MVNWGYWTDALKVPGIIIVLSVIGYIYIWKMWRIEITRGQIFSKAGFTTDFRLDITKIDALQGGTHYFPLPQSVLLIKYHSETGDNSVMIRPVAWGDKMLGQIIRDLLKLKSSIQLDDYTRAILSKAV